MQYSGKSVHTSWKMKGDLIYFPHDGPKEIHTKLTDTESWKAWLKERVAQTRDCDFRVMLVGPEGKHDKLARWILGHSTIKSQAHRLYNHLRVRRALDVAFGNEPLPELPSFVELQPFFPDGTGNKPPNPDGTPNEPTNVFVASARAVRGDARRRRPPRRPPRTSDGGPQPPRRRIVRERRNGDGSERPPQQQPKGGTQECAPCTFLECV